jgi:hypothetical protein
MTTINETILTLADNCVNLTNLFCEFANVMVAEITESGEIEYSTCGGNNWLVATDERLEEFAVWVKNQN